MSDTEEDGLPPSDSSADGPGAAIRRAAALGPLPGLGEHDATEEADDGDSERTDDNETVGTSAGDEAETVIGFRGMRS